MAWRSRIPLSTSRARKANVVRLLPPLITTTDDAQRALAILDEVFRTQS